jgi:hypothetical protein
MKFRWRAWARLTKQIYDIDSLVCPRRAGSMRIIALIEQPAVIEKILTRLGMRASSTHSPPLKSIAA